MLKFTAFLPRAGGPNLSEGKKEHTKGVFSSENSSASTGKKEVWFIPKSLFSREKERKIHIHQRVFTVFVGDPFAQHWCIDLGLLIFWAFLRRSTRAATIQLSVKV